MEFLTKALESASGTIPHHLIIFFIIISVTIISTISIRLDMACDSICLIPTRFDY